MNDLSTITGFYETYLKLLPQYESKETCFDFLNKEIEKINGSKMFLNLSDFQIRTVGKGLETVPEFSKTYFSLLSYFPTEKKCFKYLYGIAGTMAEKQLFSSYTDFKRQTFGV